MVKTHSMWNMNFNVFMLKAKWYVLTKLTTVARNVINKFYCMQMIGL